MNKPTSQTTFSAREYTAGKKIAGCYALESLLFETPVALVWKAHDDLLARDIALHFLPDSVAADEKALADIREQVRLSRQVLHPGIVRVYDLVEDVGCAAISMDLAEARPLGEILREAPGGVLQPAQVRGWLAQLLQIGGEAHDEQLLHRDLSPDAVLVRDNGDLLLTGFGVSRTVLDVLARQQPNRRDPHLPYMSPQLLDGEAPARTDDIYSFGALVFKILTGKPPFHQNDILPQIRKAVPPSLKDRRAERKVAGEPVPAEWEKAVAACLAKHTDGRPKSFKEVALAMKLEGSEKSLPPAAAAVGTTVAGAAAAKSPAPSDSKASAKPDASEKASPTEPVPTSIASEKKAPEPSRKEPAPLKKSDPVIRETSAPLRKEPANEPGRDKAGAAARLSPFAPQGAGGEPPESRKTGRGVGIVVGLALLALLLVGVIFVLGRKEEKPDSGAYVERVPPAEESPIGEGTPAPERPAPSLPDALPSEPGNGAGDPAATPAETVVLRTTPPETTAPIETPAEPSPSPAALPAVTKAENPAALAPEELAKVIAEADAVYEQLTGRQAELKQEMEKAQKASEEKVKALPAVRKEVKKVEDASESAQKAEEKAAAAAEEARQAAEASQAELKAQQEKTAAARKAAEQRKAALTDAEQEIEASAKALSDAQTELDEIDALVADAQKEQTRLASAREKLAQASLAEEAARKKQEEEKLAAAEAQRLAAEQKRAELEVRAAAAEKAAADAAALAEQARKALEEAERLRKASDEARQRADEAAAEVSAPAAATPSPVPAASPSASATPAASPGIAPGADISENSLGMKFVKIDDILFSVWPTRVRDYSQFAQATGRSAGRWKEPGFDQAADHPVVYVTWLDAIAFCQWLTEKEQASGDLPGDRTYRLPSDREWSVAVGLSDEELGSPEDLDMVIGKIYPWGSEWPPPASAGNYTGEETGSDVAIKGFRDGYVYTSPVGNFKASPTGLYDLGGNVWEWCMDWWNSQQTSKVLRGASWYNGALKPSLLSSCRYHSTPDSTTDNYGFRVVIAQVPKAAAVGS